MKIFNWVHRRLHPRAPNEKLSSIGAHKTEPAINEADTQALLEQAAVADVLGGWNESILTIGTLGFDNLKSFNQQKEFLTLECEIEEDVDQDNADDEVDKYNAEHEELNPLVCSGAVEPTFDIAANSAAEKPDIFSAIVELPPNEVVVEGGNNHKKGERITLADLFLADSVEIDAKRMDQDKTILDASNKELSFKKKHRLSFAKKLIPQVKDDSRPLKNIQQLMRRMLKRKIYPDFDVKNVKGDGQKASTEAGSLVKHNRETSDSISLLPCQGVSV